MTFDLAFLVLRVVAGLLIAGHGAQKVFGAFGGGGMAGTTAMVRKMGFQPAPLWAIVNAYAELVGGLALALGLFTGLAAAALTLNMVVVIWKAHWSRGFWNTKGGYEFPLTLAIIFAVIGLAGPGAYALDAAIGVGASAIMFITVFVVGVPIIWLAGAQPADEPMREEERRRRVA